MTAIAYETYHLGLRTTRRFIRVPANVISILFFPLIQLLVFSQLYEDIVQLPGFGGGRELPRLPGARPDRVHRLPRGRVGRLRAADGVPQRLPRQAALNPIRRWSILASEMVPLFFQAAAMAGIILVLGVVLGASIVTGIPGALLILVLAGLFGLAISGSQLHPRADHEERAGHEHASRCSCSRWSSPPPRSCRSS